MLNALSTAYRLRHLPTGTLLQTEYDSMTGAELVAAVMPVPIEDLKVELHPARTAETNAALYGETIAPESTAPVPGWTRDTLADAMENAPRCGAMTRDDPAVQCPKCLIHVGESRIGSHAARCVRDG